MSSEPPVSDNDRIERVLAALPALALQHDSLGMRSLLEDLYDAAQDDLLDDLRDAAQAAAAWGVSERRARARIAKLHEEYGIGRLVGGAWVVRQAHIDAHPPDQKYRKKEQQRDNRSVSDP